MPPIPTSIMLPLRALSRRSILSGAFPTRQAPTARFSAQLFFRSQPRLFSVSAQASKAQPKAQSEVQPEAGAESKSHRLTPSQRLRTPVPPPPPPPKPEYQITFTCTPCSTRSTHTISKQGYHKGSVLITCPECRNRHIISDHLNIFGDRNITIEDLMRERGQLVKKGTLSEDGDVEFWQDGTTTRRGGEIGEGETVQLAEGKQDAKPQD
ncbi:hypothetical protein G7Y89_g8173 [Cudoniella acicularis]|uniref:DNL-type domain-containing protein n=1 Tax=Cudoniella acicularis TaxID=354080 RepID=A0A8H4W3U5_9HELO|nr:hypothetical protein G7Y89_g8173 [Cudoniella acicularis]